MMRSQIIGSVFCLLIALGSLATVVWIVASGQAQDLDALFLILVCLLFALLFAIFPLQMFRAGLFRDVLHRKKTAPAAPDEAPISQTASQKS